MRVMASEVECGRSSGWVRGPRVHWRCPTANDDELTLRAVRPSHFGTYRLRAREQSGALGRRAVSSGRRPSISTVRCEW